CQDLLVRSTMSNRGTSSCDSGHRCGHSDGRRQAYRLTSIRWVLVVMRPSTRRDRVMRSPLPRAGYAPWHFLNFLPLPQGQGSLRPTPSNCAIAAVAAPGNAARPRLSVACTLRFGAAAGAAGGAPGNSASVGSPAPPPFASLSGRGGGG